MWWKKFYFDKQDYELLHLVNRVVNQRGDLRSTHTLFDANLHPHGIKALAMSREMRVAHAVVQLLDSLEAGASADRLRALRTLFDEVLNSAQTTLRRNTARVLLQIMKDLVRAHHDEDRQLHLAHDFRCATHGKPRVVRHMLERYHLVEMPEDWSQLSFDHHVHDANTKGRKNPTHLIMDAWIKGIRYLTIIYYNYVDPDAAREILYAAAIMGVHVRIGIEFAAPFHDRYVDFIWVPRGFSDEENFMELLAEPPVRHLMARGREASEWQQRYVYLVLEKWNSTHRHELSELVQMTLPSVRKEDFRAFVGAGQPSILHLAEFIYNSFEPLLSAHALRLQDACANDGSPEALQCVEEGLEVMESLSPALVHDRWLAPEKNPDLPSPHVPRLCPDTPELLRLQPLALLDWLTSLHPFCRITLNIAGLSAEDVLELLWRCQGLITHLEIFNLKEWYEGKLTHLREINTLQQALNGGSAPRLKRCIRDMLQRQEELPAHERNEQQCATLRNILRHIPTLQSFYKSTPLRSRMGTDSTSRSQKTLGMGLVFPQTLSPRGQTYFHRDTAGKVVLPVEMEVRHNVTYLPNPMVEQASRLTRFIRKLPFCADYGYLKEKQWLSSSAQTAIRAEGKGNIATLGGTITARGEEMPLSSRLHRRRSERPGLFYANTTLVSCMRVFIGYMAAVWAFMYTQSWWFLAWFGPIIWFAITGVRNIIQMVMAGGGLRNSTLLRWNDHVSWTRMCESLLYTGLSVPLLEMGVRVLLLENTLGYSVAEHSFQMYTIMAITNGLYITWHNILRGLPREAAIGNLFRSVLAVPLSMVYNDLCLHTLALTGCADPVAMTQLNAAIISKMASDTVAALIEGYADHKNNVRMRRWDIEGKFKHLFRTYAKLELLFPEEDALTLLAKPKSLMQRLQGKHDDLKTEIIINALDCMHFWLYQPCAQGVFRRLFHDMNEEEKLIIVRSQMVLAREREVSQLFVDGMVGRDFARALAFYLDRHTEYLRRMERLIRPVLRPGSAGGKPDRVTRLGRAPRVRAVNTANDGTGHAR